MGGGPADRSRVALIGLDWGSTHLRAYGFDETGATVATGQSESGAFTLSGAHSFDAALRRVVLPMLGARSAHVGGAGAPVSDYRIDTPMIACGMVGSKAGWREAPYCPCGASARELAANAITVDTSFGPTLAIVPGIKSAEPDVMRGEETQLVGCGVADGLVVLPGTHSKWVELRHGAVVGFSTFMTGEMNALLRGHSSLAALLTCAPEVGNLAAFDEGVHRARASAASWLHDLFVLRAAVVTGQQSEADVSTAFAGWLLGCEFATALTKHPKARRISLIASPKLVPWYELVAARFGLECVVLDGSVATARGLWRIAQALSGNHKTGG